MRNKRRKRKVRRKRNLSNSDARIKSKNIDSSFDIIIRETLAANVESNFLDNPKAVDLFQAIVINRLEIQQMTDLFKSYFLPRTAKLSNETIHQWSNSSYKKYFNITDDQLKSNFFETIRLAYISIFHKYEGFVSLIIPKFQNLFDESWDDGTDIVNYAKDNFGINLIKHWHLSMKLKRINWIANTSKHNNGYPNPDREDAFPEFPKGQKLTLTKSDFVKDSKYILDLSEGFVNLVMAICKCKSSELLASMNEGDQNVGYEVLVESQKMNVRLLIRKMKIL